MFTWSFNSTAIFSGLTCFGGTSSATAHLLCTSDVTVACHYCTSAQHWDQSPAVLDNKVLVNITNVSLLHNPNRYTYILGELCAVYSSSAGDRPASGGGRLFRSDNSVPVSFGGSRCVARSQRCDTFNTWTYSAAADDTSRCHSDERQQKMASAVSDVLWRCSVDTRLHVLSTLTHCRRFIVTFHRYRSRSTLCHLLQSVCIYHFGGPGRAKGCVCVCTLPVATRFCLFSSHCHRCSTPDPTDW